ncbi:MAG TPA: TlpA disulfide reductase family protein [Saprospiraceae bacterium]|nr:TlpA disulfide reductase family protein [Saprospiraceae bacterium]HND89494.1 TlpA disulfide reductase family protein [Saprospiraceae bacterium]HNG89887.1 TlpA disulfide reductase family protein [Saprospiraceae bacterium]
MHPLRLLPLLLLLSSCAAQPPLAGRVQMPLPAGWRPVLYLIQPRHLRDLAASYQGTVLDSAQVQPDGTFSFRKMPDAPQPVLLEIVAQKSDSRYPTLRADQDPAAANYMPLLWQNGQTIRLKASIDRLQASCQIESPGPGQASLLCLRDLRHAAAARYRAALDSLPHDDQHLLEREAAWAAFQMPLRSFADTCPQLLPALLALRWVSLEGDYERLPEFAVGQCQRWQAARPEHPWAAQLCQLAARAQLPLLLQDTLPDFPLPMLHGDTVRLRRLLGQRLTLLDFWASWCAPCRRENREVLLPLWQAHHAGGFQIVGYALESSREVWQKALLKDGADRWPQASHLLGDDAPLMAELRMRTIPANILLDAKGRVLAKNLHGDALRKWVEEYMRQ